MDQFSYISNADVSAIDQLHQQYLSNPDSVDFGWKKFFEGFDFAQKPNYLYLKGGKELAIARRRRDQTLKYFRLLA